jgi:hypothetical protein
VHDLSPATGLRASHRVPGCSSRATTCRTGSRLQRDRSDPPPPFPAALPQWAARRLQDVAAPENRGLVGLDFEALAHPEQSEGVAQIIGEILRDEQKKLAATLGGGADGRARAVLLQAFLLGAGMLSVADAAPVPKLREALDVLLAGVGLAAEKKPAGKKNTP